MFLVSVDSKGERRCLSRLEATLVEGLGSVAFKRVREEGSGPLG